MLKKLVGIMLFSLSLFAEDVCKKDSPVEIYICKDFIHNEKFDLEETFSKEIYEISKNKNEFIENRNIWLKKIRECKFNEKEMVYENTCLTELLKNRMLELTKLKLSNLTEKEKLDKSFYVANVYVYEGTKKDLNLFKKEVNKEEYQKKMKLKILNCYKEYKNFAGQVNTGYVAACKVKIENEIKNVKICYNMAFPPEEYVYEEIIDFENINGELIHFLNSRCYGA